MIRPSDRPGSPSRPGGAPRPLGVRIALVAGLVECAAFVTTGLVLAWGGATSGPLPSMIALGGFFLALGAGVGACLVGLHRGSALARGVLLTVQLLLGAALVSLYAQFPPYLVLIGVVLVVTVVIGSLSPSSRAFIGR